MHATTLIQETVGIPVGEVELEGELVVPPDASGIVLFAHGSGSSHLSPRNQFVAHTLQTAGLGTLLFDLLTRAEEVCDYNAERRFDIDLLSRRLAGATAWLRDQPAGHELKFGYFGASTGAAAALCAAVEMPGDVHALVLRGGRPDLAGDLLEEVTAPTLLIVGGWDDVVLQLNRDAFKHLRCEKRLEIVPRATHLFDEPGALEHVATLATGWFARCFQRSFP